MGVGMTEHAIEGSQASQQSDRLLWLAAGTVGAIGLTWLLISRPWSSDDALSPPPSATEETAAVAAPEPAPAARAASMPTVLSNPLRMAQLAYEAGMLVEPPDYSAWTLFAGVLAEEPDNVTAREGLEAVSGELLRRASVALEQGRLEAAAESVERILAALPKHEEALRLGAQIERSRPPEPAPPPAVRAAPAPEPEPVRQAQRAPAIEPPAAAPRVDPMLAPYEAFQAAMRENRLLTPAQNNARHFVQSMQELNAEHEFTQASRELLSTELLARSRQALEALDPEAARSWIDATDGIAIDLNAVAVAQANLRVKLIELESAKPLPASSLEIDEYVAPEYPMRALQRSIEGWVDLEFTVRSDGTVGEVAVADASHDRFFRTEAISAVSQWRFEPRIFLDTPIPQRSYTRIRFTVGD